MATASVAFRLLVLIGGCSSPLEQTSAVTTVTATVTASGVARVSDPATVTVTAGADTTVTVTEISTAATTQTVTKLAKVSQTPTSTAPPAKAPPAKNGALAGNANPSQLSKTRADGMFQSFYGDYDGDGVLGGTVPFVLRNDSGHSLYDIQVTGSATDSGGAIVGSGSSQEIVPNAVPDGGLAVGYVYFEGDKVTEDDTFEFEPTADDAPSPFGAAVDLDVTGLNHAGDTLLGRVTNNTADEVSGPVSISVMCFSAEGKIIGPAPGGGGFTEKDRLAAGESSTFSVDLFDTACPTSLVGASGYSF